MLGCAVSAERHLAIAVLHVRTLPVSPPWGIAGDVNVAAQLRRGRSD